MWWKKSRYVSQLISLNYPFIYVEKKEKIAERLMEIYMSPRRDYKLSWKIKKRSLEKKISPTPADLLCLNKFFSLQRKKNG